MITKGLYILASAIYLQIFSALGDIPIPELPTFPDEVDSSICRAADKDCQNGGYCTMRQVSFGENQELINKDDSPKAWCTCPPQWGGDECTTPRTQCGISSIHYCYNGGTCVESSSEAEYECDCRTAIYSNKAHAGKYCEYPHSSLCGTNDVGEAAMEGIFCVNKGICNDDVFE